MNKKTLIVIIAIVILFLVAIFILLPMGKKKKDTLTIKFPDNGSTGYSWKYVVDKEGMVEVSSEKDYSNCPKDVDGCGGTIIFTVKALKEGKATVTFNLTSPSNEIDRTVIYDLTIHDDLGISETHTDSQK